MTALWIFLGGGTGAVLRWVLAAQWPAPWGTLGVNVLGSALLAALMHPAISVEEHWRLALGTGMLGGFTTYSTFNLDVWTALHAGDPMRATVTVVSTLLGCLVGAAVGWSVVSAATSG
jgi:CrcB protein